MSLIVPIIVLIIVCLQVYFFVMNVYRMKEYKEIFGYESSWEIDHSSETGFVSGISGDGNKVFSSIKESISKYLGSNSGSIIDFHLLKDAVDRHCDAVENDINTLTPVPLYCGLAGTMAGVIIGLASLLKKEAIQALLLTKEESQYKLVAEGVNDLLSGVGWAMLASIVGILLTTIASLLFKRYKLQGEFGKNTFLAWLQAKLLPELPSDTSDALSKLVKNLNKFNNTFAENTSNLGGALKNVNESYRIQADIIQTVHDMDVMKMAKANVNVLKELKECTDKLELFNKYLNDIHGYTDAINAFTTQFEVEANRLHVLEEIQQFFTRHKEEIIMDSADIDVALRDALRQLKESTGKNINDLNTIFVKQAEEFKNILREEKESFEKINEEINTKFSAQVSAFPMLESKLSEISEIPEKLSALIERMEKSNGMMYKSFVTTMGETKTTLATKIENMKLSAREVASNQSSTPNRTLVICAIIIAIACVVNTANGILTNHSKEDVVSEQMQNYLNPKESLFVVDNDSVQVDSLSDKKSQVVENNTYGK